LSFAIDGQIKKGEYKVIVFHESSFLSGGGDVLFGSDGVGAERITVRQVSLSLELHSNLKSLEKGKEECHVIVGGDDDVKQ
jgi:hypothetical protein